MANTFKNAVSSAIGTSQTSVYTVPASTTTTVIGLTVSNITASAITVDVELYDNSATAYVVIGNDISIPANSTLSFISGQKIVLAESDKLAVTSSASSSLNVVASILEDI